MRSVDLIAKYYRLHHIGLSALDSEIVDEFVKQQFRAIACDIGQGRIDLATLKRKSEAEKLMKDIIWAYEDSGESLEKILGDHAKEFFELGGTIQSR